MIKSKMNEEIDRIKRETASQVKPLANNKYINTPAHIDSRSLHLVSCHLCHMVTLMA